MLSPIRRASICLAAGLLAACNVADVFIGSAHVSVTTNGDDLDLDGYVLVVDSGVVRSLASNGSFDIERLPSGTHVVELRGVSDNCAVTGENPRLASIVRNEGIDIGFTVICVATGVWVHVGTSGLDLDSNGFMVAVDNLAPVSIGLNDSLRVTYLAAGSHVVQLSGIAPNCGTASTNPQSLSLVIGQLGAAHFAMTCGALSGMVTVSAATTGLDVDTNGYLVQLDGAAAQLLPANGSLTFPGVSGGSHTITLTGAAANCGVAAGTARTVTVAVGGAVRDTARTSFALTCSAVTGVLMLSTSTTGIDTDINGYSVSVDGSASWPLPENGSVAIPGISGGNHVVTLGNASANCSAAGGTARNISVTVGGATRDTVGVAYAISCVALTGSLRISTTTTGADLDANGYTVYIDYGLLTRPLFDTGAVVIDGLSAGSHTVFLAGLDANCALSGTNLRTITVTTGGLTRDTAVTSYAITCQATGGTVKVTTTTSGSDPDPDGYSVRLVGLNYDQTHTASASGVASFTRIPPGAFFVAISDLSMNCQVGGPTTQSGTIAAGDTVAVAFGVGCQSAPELAVAHDSAGNSDIFVVKATGAVQSRLTLAPNSGQEPAYAPGGGQVAFVSYRGGSPQIYVMNADGSGQVALTAGPGTSTRPTWSPDGTRIAFAGVRNGIEDIYVMAANGTNVVKLTTGGATDPAWSPDGLRIAYIRTSNPNGPPNLWVMNADGTAPAPLSAAPHRERQPDWSPDGTHLVVSREIACDYYYGCTNELTVINADGSGEHRLISGGEMTSPRWSPDGAWVAFAERYCGYYYYYYCSLPSVQVVSSDGASRVTVLTSAWDPAWKR